MGENGRDKERVSNSKFCLNLERQIKTHIPRNIFLLTKGKYFILFIDCSLFSILFAVFLQILAKTYFELVAFFLRKKIPFSRFFLFNAEYELSTFN